jgi:16S rRNA A1518/A1519 N6-dimethyltransferase RsmA/KsgA/DIM1 with predicted DNA glycosylase/AP lyase activity
MLVDRRILAKIMEAANISKDEIVCEVGTGKGILTAELCKHARNVVSFEVDKELFRKAQTELQFQNLELINADLFNIKGKQQQYHFDVFTSNLPYSRSRDAFEWLASQSFKRAIVMVQKEFAEKAAAKPADRNYRAISALATYCFRMDKILTVGRKSFEPQPMVESVVIRLAPINTVTTDTIKNLKILFSRRNKKASTVAAKMGVARSLESKRIDELEANELVRIAETMQEEKDVPTIR